MTDRRRYEVLAANLHRLAFDQGLTLEAMAQVVGIPLERLQAILTGEFPHEPGGARTRAPTPEQTLDLAATFVWDGDTYRLDLFSNSADFRKVLGRELPSSMMWPSLLDVVREFVGARRSIVGRETTDRAPIRSRSSLACGGRG